MSEFNKSTAGNGALAGNSSDARGWETEAGINKLKKSLQEAITNAAEGKNAAKIENDLGSILNNLGKEELQRLAGIFLEKARDSHNTDYLSEDIHTALSNLAYKAK